MLIIKINKGNEPTSSEENKIKAEKAFAYFKKAISFTVKKGKERKYYSKKSKK